MRRRRRPLYFWAIPGPMGICPPLMYVINITNPALPGGPVEYDAKLYRPRHTSAGDALLAIDDKEVQVLNISDPGNITLTGKFSPPAVIKDVQGIALNQDLAYIHSTAEAPSCRFSI